MSFRTVASRAAIGAMLASSMLIGNAAVPANAQPTPPSVSLAVPAYFNDDALWDRVLAAPAVRYVIGHPDAPVAGKTYTADKVLLDRLSQAKAKGKSTLVYVTAGYDKVGWQAVADKIDLVLLAYPEVDGVFIDEINYDECDKYKALTGGIGGVSGVRGRHPGKVVVLNAGAPMLNCYEGLADGYLNLERADKDVTAWIDNVNLPGNFSAYSWMFKAERRSQIWQMVHSVSSTNVKATIDSALTRNASVLYVTNDVLPNPYDSLPDDATWKTILDTVEQYAAGRAALPSVKGLTAPATTTTPKPGAPTTIAKPASVTTVKKPTVKKPTVKKKTVVKKKATVRSH